MVNLNMGLRFLLLFIIVVPFSCQKEKPFENIGVITGEDVRMCACCGGLFFHFTKIGDTTNKRIVNAGIFQLPNNPKFPVYVEVDWEQIHSPGCGPVIKIIRYKFL
jgi:hypothetical protein